MRTVVVVDDEPITRMDIADMLEENGLRVVGQAGDGYDAVELCRRLHPNVVLMDVKMPVFDGLTASETIVREDLADCVILLTAFSDGEIVERAGVIGAAGYLVKPIDQKALMPTIEVALAQSRRLRALRTRADRLDREIESGKTVRRAQSMLARERGCTETEAYELMRRMAMDKRITLASLAGHILSRRDGRREIDRLKAWLMNRHGMSEEKAYRKIVNYAKTKGCAVEEAARQLSAYYGVREEHDSGIL